MNRRPTTWLSNTYLTGCNMKSVGTSVVGMIACALLLGACGPAQEREQDEGTEPTEGPAVNPNKKSGVSDPSASELAEPGLVTAQSMVGDLGSTVGSPAATYPSISSATNQWSVSCNGGSSRDIAYVWKVPATGSYSFNTAGSNFDTVLQVRNYKNTSEIMGCSDDVGSHPYSRVTLSGLVRGVTLLIIIEGYDGDYGNLARLNIVKN